MRAAVSSGARATLGNVRGYSKTFDIKVLMFEDLS